MAFEGFVSECTQDVAAQVGCLTVYLGGKCALRRGEYEALPQEARSVECCDVTCARGDPTDPRSHRIASQRFFSGVNVTTYPFE